jgi:hypothetical protein
LISNAKTVAAKTVAALVAIAALGLCLVSMVSAETTRQHLSAFTAGTSNGALAVDSAGNVYVVDAAESSIHRFDQTGAPVAFSALSGSNTINGSDAGPDPDKTPQNGLSLDSSSQVAVDTTGGATEGQIYVASPGQNVIDVFNPDGSYNTQITGTSTPTGTFSYSCGLALDGDTLYVGNTFTNEIDRYVRSGNPIVEGDFDAAITGLTSFGICGLAVDSGGNVYNIPNAFGQVGAVTKYAPSDFGTDNPTGTPITPSATAVAVDSADHVFADTGTSILELDSSGATAGPTFGSPFLTDSRGVLPLASGNVLASDNGGSPQIHTFGPVVDLPVVTTGTATNLAANTATLNGTVDPDGLTITDCSFQYVDDAQFQIDGYASATSASCSSTPSGSDPVDVSADISGLSPDTTYHFRLTASSADGTATGADNTFFFRTPVDPDAVALPAAGVTETSAVIGGLVDPNNFPTTYYIEYADNPAFTGSTSLPPTQDADAGDGDTAISVSAVATGLNPDTDYFFRIVAHSTAGDDTSDALTFHTLGTEPPPPVCPNAALRTGPSAQLPDCRVYEKVSPEDKDGNDIGNGLDVASLDGDAVAFTSFAAFGGSQGGGLVSEFLSQRDADGWALTPLTPLQVPTPSLASSIYSDFSPDLNISAFSFLAGDPGFDGAAPNTANIYRRQTNGTLDLISSGQVSAPPGTQFPPATNYDGGSDDLSLITFDLNSPDPVTVTSGPQGPVNVQNLYAGNGTTMVLVSILPGGNTPAPEGGQIGGGGGKWNAVSNDGSRIFWSLPQFGSTPAEVYMRSGGTTTWVSESQRTTPDPDGVQAKSYQYATPDGAHVFFTSGEKLTDDSVATGSNPDLYRYDVASGDLTDMTTQDPAGAGVQGVLGVSDSGARVYFTATGNLAAGATPGTPNLYVREGSTVTYIATLDQFGDSENWGQDFSSKTSRVTPDGGVLLFSSVHQQTSFENNGFREFYRYDLSDGSMDCVSCAPGGGKASQSAFLSASGDSLNLSGLPLHERHNLLPDGSGVFFVSPDALVPQDTNGKYDVYMWRDDGRLKLISTGQSPQNSQFVDASLDGNDVFILTRQRLVGVDRDNDLDLYDARVNGGLADQNPNEPVPCQGDDCKPPPNNPPPGGNPGTSGVSGNGNVQGGSASNCSALDAQANSLTKKANQLSAKAKKASGKQKANLQKKAKKTKKKANNARAQANQCKGQS